MVDVNASVYIILMSKYSVYLAWQVDSLPKSFCSPMRVSARNISLELAVSFPQEGKMSAPAKA